MNKSIKKLKQLTLEKVENFRLKIAANPKMIIWRLRLFGIHPFLSKHIFKIISVIAAVILLFGIFYVFSWRSPRPFPEQALVTVERGESLSQIASSFQE
jgi:hypothetical protein